MSPPSKAHAIQMVKVQLGQRACPERSEGLATNPTLNLTFNWVTGWMVREAGGIEP